MDDEAVAVELARDDDPHVLRHVGERAERLLQRLDARVAVLLPLLLRGDRGERLRLAEVRLLHPPLGVRADHLRQVLRPRVVLGEDVRVHVLERLVGTGGRGEEHAQKGGAHGECGKVGTRKNPAVLRLASWSGGAGTEKRQNSGVMVTIGRRVVNTTWVTFFVGRFQPAGVEGRLEPAHDRRPPRAAASASRTAGSPPGGGSRTAASGRRRGRASSQSRHRPRSSASSPWNGSSRISSGGRFTSARASSTSRCSPVESWRNGRSARCVMPERREQLPHRRVLLGRGRPVGRATSKNPVAAARSAVSGSVKYRWNSGDTSPTFRFTSQMLSPVPRRRPNSRTSLRTPAGGRRTAGSAASSCRDPFGPSTAHRSPAPHGPGDVVEDRARRRADGDVAEFDDGIRNRAAGTRARSG